MIACMFVNVYISVCIYIYNSSSVRVKCYFERTFKSMICRRQRVHSFSDLSVLFLTVLLSIVLSVIMINV